MGIAGFVRRVATVSEWSIGVADLRLDDLVAHRGPGEAPTFTPRVRWLPKPWSVVFQADPCLVEHQGRFFVYYEDLLVGSTRGRLRFRELTADGNPVGRDSSMMRLGHSAAYPCVFEYSGALYCVPETGAAREVALYKSRSPVGPWARECVLLEGVGARDSTVFQHGGRWWLFCTVAGADASSQWADLHIWHAPEPWGPWEPHRLQPAKKDIRSARPAGRLFVVDGALYRPSQDCGSRYGARTVINRVLTLTSDDFAEEICSYVAPDPQGLCADGLHTITSAGSLVMVDGNRDRPVFDPLKILIQSGRKVGGRLRSGSERG